MSERTYTEQSVRMIGTIMLVVGIVLGGFVGSVVTAVSKAGQVADDLHDVKKDYDKGKKVVGEKGKEILDNIDGKDLGKETTEGLKDLGTDTKEKVKEVTEATKNIFLYKLDVTKTDEDKAAEKAFTDRLNKGWSKTFTVPVEVKEDGTFNVDVRIDLDALWEEQMRAQETAKIDSQTKTE